MPELMGSSWPGEYLTGVAVPIGRPKRLLVVDRTGIGARVWPEFGSVDLFIGARTPIVYTMGHRNLLRLNESVAAAVSRLQTADSEH